MIYYIGRAMGKGNDVLGEMLDESISILMHMFYGSEGIL